MSERLDGYVYCDGGHLMPPDASGCSVSCCPHNKLAPAPLSDPTETLALIAEYRLTVQPQGRQQWRAAVHDDGYVSAYGPTIGDAVRECVARIRGEK